MITVPKVCGCVVRSRGAGLELLCFEHPLAGVQIPKGGLEPGEDPVDGVLRELHEETGLSGLAVDAHIGTFERLVGAGPDESGPTERHVWEIFLARATSGGPEEWWHKPWGSPAEEGLTFRCHWLKINQDLPEMLHPLFRPVVTILVDHLESAGCPNEGGSGAAQ